MKYLKKKLKINKYGEEAGTIEIEKIGQTENSTRIPFSEVPGGGIIREGNLRMKW